MVKIKKMSTALFWFFIMSASFVQYTSSNSSDWTKHCNACSCIWVSGRKTANCSNKGFNQIPTDISSVVRDIDFSNNFLYSLNDQEFVGANLLDVHKLRFQNCSIEVLHENAFKRLGLIIELDLSRNFIADLKKNTFRDNIKLRIINLSFNRINVLVDGLFSNMSYVQKIHVDHNEIEYINERTFYNLTSLTDINLGYNKLKTVEFDLKLKLPKLNSLNIEENPWVCDCRLETFHQSILRNNLITHETKCEEPPKLKGRLWTDKSSFPCASSIVYPQPWTQIEAASSNITLTCKVLGEPQPDVEWRNNGHIVDKDPRKTKQKYVTSKGKIGGFTWNNLTIINLNSKDKGEYKCVAKNPGGDDEKNINLTIDADFLSGGSVVNLGGSSLIIIALSVGLIVLLIIILVLVCLYCRKSTHRGLHSKRGELGSSSQECVNLNQTLEIKKGLMTDVNPICKPPRTSVPASMVSGGTEVSDAKRNLLDNESVFDMDDEPRLSDFEQPLQRPSAREMDYQTQNAHYPPDLLSFPPRSQVSPSNSNVSATTILAYSPLHSPIYDQLNIYKTLPYSKSHSTFVARVPKQGYVTIPRKPRQSWSAEPRLSIAEPVYDNLGVRSTVDGSIMSINQEASTPLSAKSFPQSTPDPGTQSEKSSSPPRPSPTPRQSKPQKPAASQTLPRNSNLMPSKNLWAIGNNDPSDEGKSKKISPHPPPKPSKRISPNIKFEDKGKDGTEV